MTTADDTRVAPPWLPPNLDAFVEDPELPDGESQGCKSQTADSSLFLKKAVQVVVDNFNRYRKPERSPELFNDDVDMMWFTAGRLGIKAIFSSAAARGILWMVTLDIRNNVMYLEVFGKMKNQKIRKALALEGETA